MKFDVNRRNLLALTSQLIGFYSLAKLSSCGPGQGELSSFYTEDEKVTVKDMYTHNQGNRGFKGDTLKAADIAKGEPVTLYLTEGNPQRGGHQHAFTVNKEHFKKLIAGEQVVMKTEVAAGHTHTVVIDPKYNPSNANSVEISRRQFEDGPAPQAQPKEHELTLAVSEGEQPMIYLSSKNEIIANSAEYCVGPVENCANKPENWFKMAIENRLNQQQIYRLNEPIAQAGEVTLHFRATKANGFMHRMIKLVRGQ